MPHAAPLEPLDENLWVASRPLPLRVGDVGTRMTVIRSGGDLLLHSPVAPDPELRKALDRLGRVRWLLGPSKVHHLFLGDFARAYPDAELCGAPGLPEKRRDPAFQHVLEDELRAPWPDAVWQRLFRGAPALNEVVFLHRPSRTLLLTDLAFHVQPGSENRARVFDWIVGAVGRFGPHRLVRALIRDRAAARAAGRGLRLSPLKPGSRASASPSACSRGRRSRTCAPGRPPPDGWRWPG
jgi:hypothetical protein